VEKLNRKPEEEEEAEEAEEPELEPLEEEILEELVTFSSN